jgi:hypothetical protein
VRRASPLALTCLNRTGCPLQCAAAYIEEWQVLPPPARYAMLAYPRMVGGCYIDQRLDGGSWQLAVVPFEQRRADHHDHGYDDRERLKRAIGITHVRVSEVVVLCHSLSGYHC